MDNSAEFVLCKSFNRYEVSLDGQVKDRKTGEILKTYCFPNGVNYVVLKVGKHSCKVKVGELIARTFLNKDKYDILKCVSENWNDYSPDNFLWYNPRTLPENNTKSWRRIEGTHSKYEVSEDGEVRSYKMCKLLKPHEVKGRLYVSLYIDKTLKNLSVAKLVAEAFVPNPKNCKIVGHIDGNPMNNKAENLIWGFRDNPTVNNHLNNKRAVDEYTLDGEYIRTWGSITMAARNYKISPTAIRKVCRGKYITAAQRVWRFKGEAFTSRKTPELIELKPGEYFRPIPGSSAEVSNYGRVRSIRNSGKLYKINDDGSVNITINGAKTTKRTYLLEAEVMLPNPLGLKRVGFIDGDPSNQMLQNLKWI